MCAWEGRPRLAVETNAGSGDGPVVQLVSRVCVRDADDDAEFYVVLPEEADAVADRVSARSPLGGALLGRHVGDVGRFQAPDGVLAVTVVSIR
jgi:transcription elongation GreA/GreB family factor